MQAQQGDSEDGSVMVEDGSTSALPANHENYHHDLMRLSCIRAKEVCLQLQKMLYLSHTIQ